jgi:hypothetical protein
MGTQQIYHYDENRCIAGSAGRQQGMYLGQGTRLLNTSNSYGGSIEVKNDLGSGLMLVLRDYCIQA